MAAGTAQAAGGRDTDLLRSPVRRTIVDLLAGLSGNADWEDDLAASDGRVPGQTGYGLIAYLVLHGGWDRLFPA